MTSSISRRVTANIAISLDGRYNGPDGAGDLASIVPYAVTGIARNHLTRIWESATTAVLGRRNAEGFLGYWPSVAADPNADARDRAYAKWLTDVDKVVFSRTLTEPAWEKSRIVNAPVEQVISELKSSGEGDILVNSSASIIKPLLAADLLDRLYLMICPEISGGGQHLFDDGLPRSKWTLTRQEHGERGEIAMIYDRQR